jgi:1-pyrroline-4-hydroxy-2-carboxylate deaminase
MNMNWQGVFPAVTTKFHQDGSLDMDMFFKNLNAQLEAGVHGIILGGTLGESSVLSQDEKIKLTTDTVNYINGKVPVILNIAEGATRDAVFLGAKSQGNGCSWFNAFTANEIFG